MHWWTHGKSSPLSLWVPSVLQDFTVWIHFQTFAVKTHSRPCAQSTKTTFNKQRESGSSLNTPWPADRSQLNVPKLHILSNRGKWLMMHDVVTVRAPVPILCVVTQLVCHTNYCPQAFHFFSPKQTCKSNNALRQCDHLVHTSVLTWRWNAAEVHNETPHHIQTAVFYKYLSLHLLREEGLWSELPFLRMCQNCQMASLVWLQLCFFSLIYVTSDSLTLTYMAVGGMEDRYTICGLV